MTGRGRNEPEGVRMRSGEGQSSATADRLLTVMQALAEAASRADVLDVALDGAVSIAGADAVAVAFREGNELVVLGARGNARQSLFREDRIPIEADGPLAESMRTGQPLVVDAAADGR